MKKRLPKQKEKYEKLQLQKKIQERKSPTQRWKKCNTVRKKKRQILTESLIDKHMILNSFICKPINVQANMKENKEKKIKKKRKIRYTLEENNNVMSRYDHKIETVTRRCPRVPRLTALSSHFYQEL